MSGSFICTEHILCGKIQICRLLKRAGRIPHGIEPADRVTLRRIQMKPHVSSCVYESHAEKA